jgi:IS30 family transposase
VSPSAVSRELQRYDKKTWRYSADRAQRHAEEKRSHSKTPGMKIAGDPVLKARIIKDLERLRSPDEIAGRLKRDGITPRVGTAAIYKWLYSEDGAPYCKYLCTRRSRKKRQSRLAKKVLIPDRISLEELPDTVGLVHTEGDLFVSPTRSHSTVCGLLVVEKESLLFTGSLIPDKRKTSIVPAMRSATRHADTCTLDNGIENVHHKEFRVASYFCDPGTPTQKPRVEGAIGLTRRWFNPKGTDLSLLSSATYQSQLHYFNSKYRKSLGYRSAYEAALERGIIARVPRGSVLLAVAFR